MADDMGDKTELPSSRKIEEARARGQVAKSTDLSGMVDLCAAAIIIAIFGKSLITVMGTVLRDTLANHADALNAATISDVIRNSALQPMLVMLPILGLMFLIAIAAQMGQFGFLWSTDALQPKFDRLNPVNGFGNLFNRKQAVKTIVSILKLVIVLWVSWNFIQSRTGRIAGLIELSAAGGMMEILKLITELATWLLALMLILAAADFLYQRWQYTQDLKMTKQEVQDERRSMEGDPQMKGKRLGMARQIAMQRINSAVPQADVIVTNPTHYSVALKYDADTMAAPRVVAKGVDFMAMRIRQVAIANGVPIVERPPLARGIYATAEVGQEVSPEFYQAVAEVLAYVYRLNEHAKQSA